MGFQKIDKKQMPQVIGLGAASVGMFGYFAFKMMVPTVSAAAPPAAVRTAQAAAPGAAPAAPGSGTAGATPADTADAPAAPAPTPGMRDPFIQTITDQDAPAGSVPPAAPAPTTQLASIRGSESASPRVPSAPPLPAMGGSAGGISPLPPMGGTAADLPTPDKVPAGGVAPMPAAPSWIVTGVLQGGGEQIAILRSGETREFAHRGEIVGGNFRVVDVTRDYVVLRHGTTRYTLPLGGPKAPDAKTRKAAQPSGAFASDAAPPTPAPAIPAPDQVSQAQPAPPQPALSDVVGTPGSASQAVSAPAGTQDLTDKH